MRGLAGLALACWVPVLVGCGAAEQGGPGSFDEEAVGEVSEGVAPTTAPTLLPFTVPPANSGTDTGCQPVYRWTPVTASPAVTNYQLQVRDPAKVFSKTLTASQANCARTDATECTVNLFNLDPALPGFVVGSGYFAVRAANGPTEADYGPWAPNFTYVIHTPGQTTNSAPAKNGSAGLNPTYRWTAVAAVDQYRLQVFDTSTNTEVVDVSPTAADCGCPAGAPTDTTCSYQPPGVTLVANHPYRWQVLTFNNTNFVGCWSIATTFTVSASGLGPATLVSPKGATTQPITFRWNAVSGATAYRLWAYDGEGVSVPKINQVFTAAEASCAGGTGQCFVTSPTTLAPGNGTWWILSLNATTNGGWSEGFGFTIGTIGTPTQISPTGAQATNTPTYTWTAVADATQYALWVDDSVGKPKIYTFFTPTQAGCPTGTGNCSVTPTTAIASGSATWWVQANSSAWTLPPLTFTVP